MLAMLKKNNRTLLKGMASASEDSNSKKETRQHGHVRCSKEN